MNNNNSHFTSNERKIFVGNLPWNVDKDRLRGYFSPFGQVISADIVKNEKKQSNGCGFVIFADILSVEFVLSRSQNQTLPKLDNRLPYVRRYCLNYDKWSPNIVLRDLPLKTCSKSLTDKLSAFGPIMEVKITTRGIGYAKFKHKWDARKCVEKGEIILDKKKVKVLSDTENEKSPRVKNQSNNLPSTNEPKLFIKDLPHSITKPILQRHFSKYGSNTAFITQSKNKRQFAQISFTDRSALNEALKASHCINGFEVTVELHKNKSGKTDVKPNSSTEVNQLIEKCISMCYSREATIGLRMFGIVSGILPWLLGYPIFGIIALFSLFVFLHYHNVYGLKQRKNILTGGVSIFLAAIFLTSYVKNILGFREFLNAKVESYFRNENHYRRRY